MSNYNSIEGNVLFPTIDGYDMHKAGDMALYLAHCDFYPFKSVIDNNKMAIDLVTKAYRDMAQEAREKDDFRTESWAMTSGTLQACRVDILTQYSLLLTMVSLLEEAVNTLCRIHKDLGQLTTELKDVKGAGLERAAKYLKDVVGISDSKLIRVGSILLRFVIAEIWLCIMVDELKMISSRNVINLILDIEKKTLSYTLNMLM